MTELSSLAAVYEQIDRVRRGGAPLTNFYPTPEKLQRWIDRGELFSTTVGGTLFVLRKDRDFMHLSYIARTTAELAGSVRELVAQIHGTITVDVIGKRAQVDEIVALFASAGFHGRRTLHRMTRLANATSRSYTPDPDVVLATAADAAELAGMLETELDRFTEQIPDKDEMAAAALARKIFVVRSGSEIAGLLFFELTGQSSLLRHWVVAPAHRDKRVGARLMHRYFAECKDARRFTLWVISDNDNAIDRYRHYGYDHDGLIDQVLIRQAS